MKNRGTYALLALFFAFLIGLWAANFAEIPTGRQKEQMNTRILSELLHTRPDDLRRIEILGGENGPLAFKREEGNRWQMKSPKDVAADPSMVETLAFNLKELSRRPEAGTFDGDPGLYGLAPPQWTVRLWGNSPGEPLASLEVGRESVGRRYVRPGGSGGVEMVDAKGLDILKLAQAWTRWRDREVFRVPTIDVDAIQLTAGEKELKLRRGRDAWRIASPIPVLAADLKVEGLIADLGMLKVLDDSRFVAEDVPDSDLERYGLKSPTLTIKVDSDRNRQRKEQILLVGKPIPDREGLVYAKLGDQDDIVALESRLLKSIRPEPNLFRSPKVADITPSRVVRIGVEGAEGSFEVFRSGNDWTLLGPSPARADRQAIQTFLKSLEELQTSEYPTLKSVGDPGLDKPALTLKVWQAPDPRDPAPSASTGRDSEPTLTLQVGRRDLARKSIYARIKGDPTILALGDSANEILPRTSLMFRDRRVLFEEVDRIERIKFLAPARKLTLQSPPLKLDPFGNGPLGWWMVEPVDAPADAPSVGLLLRLLSGLRAESLVADKADDLARFGLKSPALTVTWSSLPGFSMVDPPPAPGTSPGAIALKDRSLLVGSPVPGKAHVRFAKLGDRPMIFTLGPDALDLLDLEWRDHHVLNFDPKRVKKVAFEWPDRALAVEATGEGPLRTWSLVGQVDAPDFDLGSIKKFVQDASRLETARYTQHVGDFDASWGLTPPRLTVRFELDDGSKPRTLKFGASAIRNQVFATAEEQPRGPIFLLPRPPYAALVRSPRHHDDLPYEVFAP